MRSVGELSWPIDADESMRREVHALVCAVVASGGAIGYRGSPDRQTCDAWLDSVLTAVRAGDGALVLGRIGGKVAGCGVWRRRPAPVFHHSAELQQVMTHPELRGRGLGRAIVLALIDSARAAGIELLILGVRGNNHRAIELYASTGFREWGRVPNGIAVYEERYDDVRMYRELSRPEGVVLRGSPPDAPNSSPPPPPHPFDTS